jgi:cytochrome c-type biogenesis protein CcmH/NrfF
MHTGVFVLLMASALPLTPKQSAEVVKVEHSLVAPCCYTQSIADHMSDIAEQMRQEVTEMVASGESQQEILAHYKALYGSQVLIVPDGRAGQLAFLVPWLVFAMGTVTVTFVLRRMLRARTATGGELTQPADPGLMAMRRRIQDEVREFF